MNETGLEDLVINLTGDGSEYAAMLEEAQDHTEEFAGEIKQETKEIEGFASSIKVWASAALQALASLGGQSFLSDSLHEWDTAERTAIRLEAAIKAQGGTVEDLMPKYTAFADEMERLSEMGDDATYALLAQAEALGVSGAAAVKATGEAIALAAAGRTSTEAAIKIAAEMAKGDMKRAMMFSRSISALRGVKDETQFLAKYQALVNAGMESTQKEAATATGRLNQLGNAFGNLKEDIGKIVADTLKPFIDVVMDGVSWMRSLSDETKTTVVTVIMLTSAVIGLTAAITAGWAIFNVLTGGMGAGLIAVGVGVTAAVGGVALLTTSLGGIGKTFEMIKAQALAAWDWLKPVRQAVGSLWAFIQETATVAWEYIKTTAVEAWALISDSADVNWGMIRDYIQDAILLAEFVLRNFSSVAQLTWTLIQLGFLSLVEDFIFFFDTTLPELLDWFAEQFPNMVIDAIDMATKMIENRFHNIATLWTNLMEILSGERSLSGLFDGLKNELDGVTAKFTELPKLTKRGMTDAEKGLAEDARKQLEALEQGWEEFHTGKMIEFSREDDAPEEAAKEEGEAIGSSFTEGVAGEIQKLDGVLSGSAEALARVREYQDRISNKAGNGKASGIANTSGNNGTRGVSGQNMNPGSSTEEKKGNDYLKEIAGYTRKTSEMEPIEVVEAGL